MELGAVNAASKRKKNQRIPSTYAVSISFLFNQKTSPVKTVTIYQMTSPVRRYLMPLVGVQ